LKKRTKIKSSATTKRWVEIQTEVTTSNACVMMLVSSTSKRSGPMNDTTDKKRKSGETREELDSWLFKEEEDYSKKRKEEKDSLEKERSAKKEELNKKPSSSDIDKKLRSECKKNKKLTRLKRT